MEEEKEHLDEEEHHECASRTGVESVDSTQQQLDKICDPNLRRNYLEYKEVVRQIAGQNITCQRIKDTITQRCCKHCRSEDEEREIRVLRCCLERENTKLSCLTQQAIRLQGNDPDTPFGEVSIVTTIDEDFMPTQMDLNLSKRLTDAICNKDNLCVGVSCDPCDQEQSSSSSSVEATVEEEEEDMWRSDKVDEFLRCLLHRDYKGEDPSSCGEVAPGMAKNVLKRLAGGENPSKPPYPRQERSHSDSSSRDRTVNKLHRKIKKMQGKVGGLISKHERMVSGTDEDPPKRGGRNIKELKKTINHLQNTVDTWKNKLVSITEGKVCCPHREKDQGDVLEETPVAQLPQTQKSNELNKLRTACNDLKYELVQKNAEITDMKRLIKPLIYRRAAGADNTKDAVEVVERSEVMVLRARNRELEEEQEEFKCLVKEQAQQLDNYRRKYMEAQQKFEEQKVVLNKMDANNKRLEDQINSEVQSIKSKFQEKIAELSLYPCILESEQLKLAQISKEKDDLEEKLKIICKELKAMQAQKEATLGGDGAVESTVVSARVTGIGSGAFGSTDNCTEASKKRKEDYGLLEKQNVELLREKDKLLEQLQKTKQDLSILRNESAKIIARTKQRSECARQSMQDHIDRIEKELAQCRASACSSVSDREEIIKEMTGQMNTLSFSFDAAQKQIKSLKAQVGFLASDNTNPVKS